MPLLQLAIDTPELEAALSLAREAGRVCDILEVGTPLIVSEGVAAVEALRAEYPTKTILADLKIMDAGRLEAECAFRRGADIVSVLALAADRTLAEALACAAEHGGSILVDLINCPDPVGRARQCERLGAELLCLHLAHDAQGGGADPLERLRALREAVGCRIAVAGGLQVSSVAPAVRCGAEVLIVGSAIAESPSPAEAAARFAAEARRCADGG